MFLFGLLVGLFLGAFGALLFADHTVRRSRW
jgi:gas vesicle protein